MNQFEININDDTVSNICIEGYFQSIQYFQSHFDYICEHMLDWSTFHYVQQCFHLWKLKQSKQSFISIHIRGTDYLDLSHIYLSCKKNYYDSILQNYEQKQYQIQYILFTDDNDEIKKHHSYLKKYRYKTSKQILQEANIDENDENDFYLFMLMNESILSNSTFSLFASYFNKHIQKLYIPKNWYKKNSKIIFHPQQLQLSHLSNKIIWIDNSKK